MDKSKKQGIAYLAALSKPAVGRNTMEAKKVSISEYTYTLPEERIALHPLEQRDSSRLLVAGAGQFREDVYRNISSYLPADSLIVFNDTRVVEARIIFQKSTGAQVEIFCLEPADLYPDITSAMLQKARVHWNCLIGGASKWKPGQVLSKAIPHGTLEARFISRKADCFEIELSWSPAELSFAEVLHLAGLVPLPPYIKRNVEEGDTNRYQTIYATHDGSVAAPTAGLHFTEAVLKDLSNKNIQPLYITLHVGAGTFRPVKTSTMGEHDMHAEYIDVPLAILEELVNNNKHCTAVGTTSLRTLESLYWIGLDMKLNSIEPGPGYELDQWFPWKNFEASLSTSESLQLIIDYLKENQSDRLLTKTRLLIMPGYSFKMVNALVTNFHQPQSTLLLLVAAFVGQKWRQLYQHALDNNFRFLSYGDGCLLFRSGSGHPSSAEFQL